MSLNRRLQALAASARVRRSERGQALLMFAAFFVVLLIMGAIAIDYSLWLSERRGVARAADLAALAAAQDLPASPPVSAPIKTRPGCGAIKACLAAFDWADKNGYGVPDGASVTVQFFCGNNFKIPPPGVCKNEAQGSWPFMSLCPNQSGEIGCDAVNVIVKKPAIALFFKDFGGAGINFDVGYGSWGNVTFKLLPTDTTMAFDVTGSMAGAKLTAAKAAANKFTDILLTGTASSDPTTSLAKVGLAPYNACYNPPRVGSGAPSWCVPAAHGAGSNNLTIASCTAATPPGVPEVCLTTNATKLHTAINGLAANGNTNICLGLLEAGNMFNTGLGSFAPSTDPQGKRYVVLLSDGDNNYSSNTFNLGQNHPPATCRPASPSTDDPGGSCSAAPGANERDLDVKTNALANVLKNPGNRMEIYVIALTPCTDNSATIPSAAYCSGIGNNNSDNVADRRLMKCIASSSPGTNDHYFESPTSAQLDGIFQSVAYEIAERGLTQLPPN